MRPFPVPITLLIGLSLTVPFGLRVLSPRLEPHPAILFPSGASVIRVDRAEVSFERTTLWGASEAGEWFALDPGRFLHPIPVQYLDALAANDFGLVRRAVEPVVLRYVWSVVTPPGHVPSVADVAETRRWLAERLVAFGADPAVMRASRERLTLEVPTGRSLRSEVLSTRLYRLNDAH